jgi:hypothetical protein
MNWSPPKPFDTALSRLLSEVMQEDCNVAKPTR